MLRCEGLGNHAVNKRDKNSVARMSVRNIVACKNKGTLHKMGLYIFKYIDKRERIIRTNETEREIN
jgi:hypothetical protein